tara:strand:- start:883 stop:1197 length:315 start_codon:yes stop_codon:yes gene_type:complete
MVIPEDEKTQETKLEEEVAALKTRIKNTEYDLTHMFKGNDIVQQKLDNTKKLLTEKETLLGTLKANGKMNDLKKLEDNILEKDKNAISEDQEKIINKAFESELK